MIIKSIPILLLFLVLVTGAKNEKVRLTDVQSLTLYKNQYTTGRRAPPIPQLKCLGGTASKLTDYYPDVVQCYNRGSDGDDVQWECKADLDNSVKFGKLNVYCEGYDYPDDPYILKGSCGLEYYLDYVGGGQKYDQKSYTKTSTSDNDSNGVVIFLIGCAIVFFLYLKCRPSTDGEQPRDGRSQFRGGGPPPPPPYGGPPPPYDTPSAPPGDAPPPYGFRPDNFPNKQGASASGYTQEQQYRQQRHEAPGAGAGAGAGAAAGGGPGGAGFWTGMGAGGLMGYLFGRNTGPRGYNGAGSSWFQPGYGPPRNTYGDNRDFGFFGSGNTRSSSSAGSSGMGTRSASGFGGTRRR